MKKNRFIIIAVIFAVIVLFGVVGVYSYYTPAITLNLGSPVDADTDFYTETVSFAYSTKFGFPVPEKLKENFTEFAEKNEEVQKEIVKFAKPTNIHVKVEIKNDQTLVTYSGTATALDGKTVNYNKQLTFDFILTKNIPSNLQD